MIASYTTDWTGRFRGSTAAVVRPGTAEEVAAPPKDVFSEIEGIGYSLYFIDGATLHPIDQFDLDRHQLSSVVPDEFTPFSMPEGYVYNFCAVAKPDVLSGVPGFAG